MILNLLVLTTILCWGAWGIFDKKALERSSDRDVLLILYLIALPEIPILYLILNYSLPGWHLSWPIALWAGLGSVTSSLAMFAYLFAMSRAEASYVLGITASYPLIMQFLASAFLGEKLVVSRLIGSCLIGLGVAAVGQSAAGQNMGGKQDKLIVLICVCLATFGWGVHGLFDKKAVELADPLVVFFTRSLVDAVTLCIFAIVLKLSRLQVNVRDQKTWRFSTFSSALFGDWISFLSPCHANFIGLIRDRNHRLLSTFDVCFCARFPERTVQRQTLLGRFVDCRWWCPRAVDSVAMTPLLYSYPRSRSRARAGL